MKSCAQIVQEDSESRFDISSKTNSETKVFLYILVDDSEQSTKKVYAIILEHTPPPEKESGVTFSQLLAKLSEIPYDRGNVIKLQPNIFYAFVRQGAESWHHALFFVVSILRYRPQLSYAESVFTTSGCHVFHPRSATSLTSSTTGASTA